MPKSPPSHPPPPQAVVAAAVVTQNWNNQSGSRNVQSIPADFTGNPVTRFNKHSIQFNSCHKIITPLIRKSVTSRFHLRTCLYTQIRLQIRDSSTKQKYLSVFQFFFTYQIDIFNTAISEDFNWCYTSDLVAPESDANRKWRICPDRKWWTSPRQVSQHWNTSVSRDSTQESCRSPSAKVHFQVPCLQRF